MILQIPDTEYQSRLAKFQLLLKENNFDAALVFSNEQDYTNVRYFTNFWPAFDTAGLLVPAEGEPFLLVGPESETYALDRSRIGQVRKMLEFRESADPAYPDIAVATFAEVFMEALGGRLPQRIGLVSRLIFPALIYESLKTSLPGTELAWADRLVQKMRFIKSDNEITLLREAFRIAELAIDEILSLIRPGLTELQVVGMAQKVIYEHGAEYEGMPQFVFAGSNSRHAVARATHRVLEPGDLVQLNISARVEGYSSGVGRPVCLGRMKPEVRALVQAGLDAHRKTAELMRPGVSAKDIVDGYYKYLQSLGYGENMLYGPCHGLGMLEVEPPWMELNSDYVLEPHMTFQIDTFLKSNTFGLRWENGIVVTDNGIEFLSDKHMQIIEII